MRKKRERIDRMKRPRKHKPEGERAEEKKGREERKERKGKEGKRRSKTILRNTKEGVRQPQAPFFPFGASHVMNPRPSPTGPDPDKRSQFRIRVIDSLKYIHYLCTDGSDGPSTD